MKKRGLQNGRSITVALLFVGVFLLLPLINVFYQAFSKGWALYRESLIDPNTIAAIKLTLFIAAITVPLNLVFGIAASWAIAKFEFRGKAFLITLIDLPFAVSPVVAGLMFVVLFGREGFFGEWLDARDIKIIFAWPGMALATVFITFPFVARELIPVMQATGKRAGTGRVNAGRERLEDVLVRDVAFGEVGTDLRRDSLQCARHGGIRRSVGCVRAYRRNYRHFAAAGGQAVSWRVRGFGGGRVCRGQPAGGAGVDHARF